MKSKKFAFIIASLIISLVGTVYVAGDISAVQHIVGSEEKDEEILALDGNDSSQANTSNSASEIEEAAYRANLDEKRILLEIAEKDRTKYEEKPGIEDEEAARKNKEEKERLERDALNSKTRYEEKPGIIDEEAARKSKEEKEKLEMLIPTK